MTTSGETHHADALDRPRLAVVRSALPYAVFLSHGLNGSKCIGKRHRWPTLWQAVVEDDGHHPQTDDPPSHVCALVCFRPSVIGRIVSTSGHDHDGVALPVFNDFSFRQINVDRALVVTCGQRKPGGWQRIMPPLRIMGSLRDHGLAPLARGRALGDVWFRRISICARPLIAFCVSGIFQAKKSIRDKDNCYLVEGYTDVISLYQAGIENVVASSGTSLTEDQIKLISRFTKNVTVLYDGDKAGIKASLRGVDLILEKGLDVNIVTFPEGEDPDSFVRNVGGEKFAKYIEDESRDFILFKTSLGLKESEANPIKKADVIRDIVTSIVKIPDAIKRSVFYRECSSLLGIDEELLIDEGNKILIKEDQNKRFREGRNQQFTPDTQRTDGGGVVLDNKPETTSKTSTSLNDPVNFQERECVRILLEYGNQETEEGSLLYRYILEEIEQLEFNDPISKRIINEFSTALEKGEVLDSTYFTRHPDQQIKQLVVDMITEKNVISENWKKHHIIVPEKDAKLHQVVYSNVLRLKYRTLKKMCQESMDLLGKAKTVDEEMEALQIFQTLKQQENELAKFLGIVYS